ncbi:MAG: NAD(P)/FAD-dependent oxidoreductase [Oscillospiraceae bacterium]|nr:NAD(P)/FAD-dependent oxidoreductase [Oscillospiraceae bacterium]
MKKDVIIVGGGPAGLAAAIRLREKGVTDILVIERERHLGGILRQCIHDGFGLVRFSESLSGPEYAQRFIDMAEGLDILTDTTVISISEDKVVTAISKEHGYIQYQAGAVILAMGCRERTRGAISLPGSRPAGVLTAGVAQSYINLHNTMVGKEVVILGSGDIGMIMARRLTLEGAHVQAVLEILPHPSGLPRNIQQCLNDYDIPLYLNHTVIDIQGKARLNKVITARVDENKKPIPGTEIEFDCDTLVLSVGLIPENELSLGAGVELDPRTKGALVDEHFQTTVPGIFSAGNVLHVHDLVDFVSVEAESFADSVVEYLGTGHLPVCSIPVEAGAGICYALPQRISGERDFLLSMRVREPLKNCAVTLSQNGETVLSRTFHKALPAEMIQIPVKAGTVKPGAPLEVAIHD